ncbi:MAG: 4Fe-4S dicluster domain-containing protein [Lachnospiraceae bacterium]|nr:4Fe-4S dicluster domain-containing protein [Lachnospiraceae bacterium]
MKIICDNEKCSGCLACVVACTDHHYAETENDAVSGRIYKTVTEPSGYTRYVTESCRHCENAPCIDACPVNAISEEGGWVLVDRDICIGCQMCSQACPFDIPRFRSDGKMFKCDGCGGDPACVKICPNGALKVE